MSRISGQELLARGTYQTGIIVFEVVGDNVGKGADEYGRVVERRGSCQVNTELLTVSQYNFAHRSY